MITGSRNDGKKRKVQKEGYQSKANLYNFIIFKNYDGSTTSRVMKREMYNKLFPDTCNSE